MRRVLATDHGWALYRKRRSIELMLGPIKANRRIDRFQRKRQGRGAV